MMGVKFNQNDMVAQLQTDEGLRLFVYDDATGLPIRAGTHVIGNPTVGIGRNLSGKGITTAEAVALCLNDIAAACTALTASYPWWTALSAGRQMALVDLYFNMGGAGLATFHDFLACMESGDFQGAVGQLQSSRWWGEVSTRGPRIAAQILAG